MRRRIEGEGFGRVSRARQGVDEHWPKVSFQDRKGRWVCLSHRVILQISPAGCLTPYGAKTAKETVAGKTGVWVRDDWREELGARQGQGQPVHREAGLPVRGWPWGGAEDYKGGRGKQGRTGKGGEVCVMERKDGECAKGGAKQVVFIRRVGESGGRRKSGESGRLTGTGARQTAAGSGRRTPCPNGRR